VPAVQFENVKDPDFFEVINLSLQEIANAGKYDVIVNKEIREIDIREAAIKVERCTVTIEPGCPGGKEFRFIEAGHRDPLNIAADLVVTIQTKPHPLYERNGSDLTYTAKIPLKDVCIFLRIYSREKKRDFRSVYFTRTSLVLHPYFIRTSRYFNRTSLVLNP
jgi:hypothetical protein